MDDQKEAYIQAGKSEEEAELLAVKEMGDPMITGQELDKIHRPKVDLGITITCDWHFCNRNHHAMFYMKEYANMYSYTATIAQKQIWMFTRYCDKQYAHCEKYLLCMR